VPTATFTPGNMTCSSESVVYQNCLNETLTESDIDACRTCIKAAVRSSNGAACGELQASVCEAVSFCPCEGCLSLIENYLSCLYESDSNCPIQCSNETAQLSCANEWHAYTTCMYSDLSENDSASCRTCVSSSQESVAMQSTDCLGVQTQACGSLENCTECGTCSGVAHNYLSCHLIDQSRDTCGDINCGTSPESTPSPQSAPSLNSGDSPIISGNTNESNTETQPTSWSRRHCSSSYQSTIVSTLVGVSLVFSAVL
jgi:hypothetical protein